jgi:gamma-glutamyltranspeptidase/glutathione hydrolase
LRNPDYAATLRRIAEQGAAAFYTGPIAQAIVAAVSEAPRWPGDMTLADLAGYHVQPRPPLCFIYRARTVCSMGPPSSGGTALAQILGLIEPTPPGRGPGHAGAAEILHRIAEAQKLAYADRDRWLADPDHVTIPSGLTAREYLSQRRRLISPDRAMAKPPAGEPPGPQRRSMGVDATLEIAGTSHLSVVDGTGNAVALTTTIEAAFGARIWAAGFLLNNQLTDFSRRPVDAQGRPIANAVGPGKRPRSSMAPTLVLDRDGRVSDVLGSPGGSRIILYVAKALIALIDWQMDPQQAADLANFGSRGETFEAEPALGAETLQALARLGHKLQIDDMTSGLHIVSVREGRIMGGADPRREGVAAGD